MIRAKKKNKTYYRYAAVYFAALFLIAALVMTAALILSAREMENQEMRNLENSMKQAAEVLEKQYEVMESIALQVGTRIDFRPYRAEQGGVYDIDLLERFKQYANYSPLASHYFLVYRSAQKIYTSSGNTSYFDYYAPANLEIPYELTADVFRRINEINTPYFDLFGSSILAVLPVRFLGLNGTDVSPASLCFVLTKQQIRAYLAQMTAGLPESYDVSISRETILRTGSFDAEATGKNRIEVASVKGRVRLRTDPDFSGWTLIFERNSWLIVAGIVGNLLLSILTALSMARFSLRPLDRLIEKYAGDSGTDIENEFWALDGILSEMEQSQSGSQYQLRNHLLILMLRGNYSEKIMRRWAMLGISFDHPLCCVYLIENASASPLREEMGEALEGLSNGDRRIFTAEMEEEPFLIVIANYEDVEAQEEIENHIAYIASKHQRAVHTGKAVETPKRLSISFMAALTESRLNTAPGKRPVTTAQLSDRLIAAVISGNAAETEQAGAAIRDFLSDEPLNGTMTRHHTYDLASNIIRKAEEKGMNVDRAALNALVLLPDPELIVHDMTELLKKEADAGIQTKVETDESARLIVEYVIANACDPDLNLQTMSEAFGFSADYISSMIKRETGSSFKEYVTMLRIGEARRLLSDDKSLTVNDVAQMVGYRKASNFSKKYKELTGMLPSQNR